MQGVGEAGTGDVVEAVRHARSVLGAIRQLQNTPDEELMAFAKEIQAQPDPRELDVMVSTGEPVTIALLSMALMDLGLKARSYTGGQVKILTDSAYTKARIVSIDQDAIRRDLSEGYIVVVAGFQGVDGTGNITTLGRGGSDTTGVALAAALAQLPDDQRAAVEVHHLQGCTLSETAAVLDRTERSVAGLLRRGLVRLRELLEE